SCGVRHYIADVLSLFIRVRSIPCSEGATDKTQVFFALNSFVDLSAEALKSIRDLLKVVHELIDLPSVLFQPLRLKSVSPNRSFLCLEADRSADKSAHPGNTAESCEDKLFDDSIPIGRRGLGELRSDELYRLPLIVAPGFVLRLLWLLFTRIMQSSLSVTHAPELVANAA